MDTQTWRPLKARKKCVFCHVVNLIPSVHTIGHPQKKGLSPARLMKRIKLVKSVDPCLFAPDVQNVPSALTDLPVGVLASLARDGCKSLGGIHFEGGLHPTFQTEVSFYQVTYDSKRLCESHK